jgi:hypothetical protein
MKTLLFLLLITFNCKEKLTQDAQSILTNLTLLQYRNNKVTISGSAVKGIVKTAKVNISLLQSNGVCSPTPFVTTTTDSKGFYTVDFVKTNSVLCISIIPETSNRTSVFDEKSNQDIPVLTGSKFALTTIIPESKYYTKRNSVTSPFSRLAARRIQFLAGKETNPDLEKIYRKASKEIVIRFGLNNGLGTSTVGIRNFETKNTALSDSNYPDLDDIIVELEKPNSPISKKFISILVGFSQLASKFKSGAVLSIEDIDAIIDAFAIDFEDGIFDGKDATGKQITIGPSNTPLGSNSITSTLFPAIQEYIQQGGKLGVGNGISTTSSLAEISQISFNDTTPIISSLDTTITGISYPSSSVALAINQPASLSPIPVGATPTSCTSSPNLPTGLTLNSDCKILGTPTTLSASTNYTITGQKNSSSASTVLTLSVVLNQYTFTNAGAVGRQGPSQSQIDTAYVGTLLQNSVTVTTTGIQRWVVPSSGTYRIEANGAQGANNSPTVGRGATIIGDFSLSSGDILWILVGQQGLGTPGGYAKIGGGGGSFVATGANQSSSTALIVAGGGGGTHSSTDTTISRGATTQAGSNGNNTGGTGTAGNGGTGGSAGQNDSNNCSSAASGFSGSGTSSQSFLTGGLGAVSHSSGADDGGFGGGGAIILTAGPCTQGYSAGGGGYSGGGASNGANGLNFPGGGGGSFNSGTNPSNTAGNRSGHGLVIITKL